MRSLLGVWLGLLNESTTNQKNLIEHVYQIVPWAMALGCKGSDLLEMDIKALRKKIKMINETPDLSLATAK